MFDAIIEFFQSLPEQIESIVDSMNLDMNVLGLAVLFWALCLLMIWKFFDPTIMKLHLKIVMTFVMLPVCYLLVKLMSTR